MGMVKFWRQTQSAMGYNCLHHLRFVFCWLDPAYDPYLFLPVTISCQLLIARCVFNFSVNDIQEMDNCHVYDRSVLPHAKKWNVLYGINIKSISLNHEDQNYFELNIISWYCCNSLSKVFPFNQIEENVIFISDVSNMGIDSKTIDSLSKSLFNTLELKNDGTYSTLCDFDLDANFFNELLI